MSNTPSPRSVNNELRFYYLRFMLHVFGFSLVYIGWPLAACGAGSLALPGFFGVVWKGVLVQNNQGKVVVISLGAGLMAAGAGLLWVRRRLPPGISPWEVAGQAVRTPAQEAEPLSWPPDLSQSNKTEKTEPA